MEEFLETASSRLPNLRGLKYTDFDLMEFSRCVTLWAGKYQILYGADQVSPPITISVQYLEINHQRDYSHLFF